MCVCLYLFVSVCLLHSFIVNHHQHHHIIIIFSLRSWGKKLEIEILNIVKKHILNCLFVSVSSLLLPLPRCPCLLSFTGNILKVSEPSLYIKPRKKGKKNIVA
jgi:hypothetical protein